MAHKTVSAIIPTISGREALLAKLMHSLPKDVEILVMDDEDMMLSEKRNKAASYAAGEYLLFVDDDNWIEKGSVELAAKALMNDEVGIVGFMACYDNKPDKIADGGSRRNYLTGFTEGMNTNLKYSEIRQNPYFVDEVANCFMIKKDLFNEMNGFDSMRYPTELDEADLCKRIKDTGRKIIIDPEARCYHKSQTYTRIPDFRYVKSAYYMGKNRIQYQRQHLNRTRYLVYLYLFMPIFVMSYVACLMLRARPCMAGHFLRGVYDGLHGSAENKY